jgi:hypothetical protein
MTPQPTDKVLEVAWPACKGETFCQVKLRCHCLQVCCENLEMVHARKVVWQDGRTCLVGLRAGRRQKRVAHAPWQPASCGPSTAEWHQTPGPCWALWDSHVTVSSKDWSIDWCNVLGTQILLYFCPSLRSTFNDFLTLCYFEEFCGLATRFTRTYWLIDITV